MPLTGKPSVGLDIADSSIEVVELALDKNNPKIISMGRGSLPPGIVERGRIKDPAALTRAIQTVFSQARPKPISTRQVVFGLPESQVYIHLFQIDSDQSNQLDQLVKNEASITIPLKEDDLMISHSVLAKGKDKLNILLIGISLQVFQEWQTLLQQLGLEITFDVETLATFRGIFVDRPQSPVCIADIGAATTNIAIFTANGLNYSYTLDVAGYSITKQLSEQLEISHTDAENLKIKEGIADNKQQSYPIIVQQLDQILDTIKSSLEYYQEKNGQPVKKLVLVGGTSKLKGLQNYFKNQLSVSIWSGESFLLKNKSSLEYVEAIGLGLRGLNRPQDQTDPVIHITSTTSSAGNHEQSTGDSNHDVNSAVSTQLPGSPTTLDLGSPTAGGPIEMAQISKLKSEKFILIIILIIALLGLGAAFWYRDYQREQRQSDIEARLEKIAQLPDSNLEPALDQTSPLADTVDSDSESTPSGKLETAEAVIQVLILDTPTGWLNVRSGPGVENEIIVRAEPDETYPLLDESDGWSQIQIDEDTTGWVSSDYVEVVEE